jgi:D-psicose/D-tagatose/L-ribulose 3-epimerase
MRLALCAETIRHLDFRRQCAFARAVGYDGLEVALFRLGP